MIYQKKTINNVPTKRPISNSVPVGNPVGTIISTYKKIQPRNYLYCDGSTFDETIYPALYLYLGSNVLPDYRECAMVGAEKNTTDVFDSTETNPSTGLPGTQNHDVYSQGEFKDDQLQQHTHPDAMIYTNIGTSGLNTGYVRGSQLHGETGSGGGIATNKRSGTTTRGKRKAVYYYIKAVDGVDISDEDSFLNIVKNYVDSKNSYSTDELPTGGVWIDGKPIYRKVIACGALPNNTTKQVPHGISNLDFVTKLYGSSSTNSAIYLPIPLSSTTSISSNIGLYISGDSLFIETGIDRSTHVNTYITIEYTKTTD